jgi:hypothetical protein
MWPPLHAGGWQRFSRGRGRDSDTPDASSFAVLDSLYLAQGGTVRLHRRWLPLAAIA